MQKAMFKATKEFLGEAVKRQLLQSMAKAGQEEKEHATANNQFNQGVPYISVVADGGWWAISVFEHRSSDRSCAALTPD